MVQLGIYQHYKGKLYQVIGISRYFETLEEMVVYQALYDNYGLWVRPLSMFCEIIIFKGSPKPRFRFILKGLGDAPSVSLKVKTF